MNKLNFKMIFVFILLVILSVSIVAYKDAIMGMIKSILQWELLNITLWLSFACCFLVHYFSIESENTPEVGLIYNHFGRFADSAFALITYGLASTTSVAILEGIYIQQFFGEKIYFNYFDKIDIYSMLVVCGFLLGYSIFAALSALKEAIKISKAESIVPIES